MELLGKRIIIRKIEQEKSESAILLVAESKKDEHFYTGTIVVAGKDTTTPVGSEVLVSAYQVGEVEWEGEKLLMCLEEELIGIE